MFESYMNTYVGWKRRSGSKDNGTSILEASKSIASNVEFKRKLIRNAQGEQIVSVATITTSSRVSPGDVLTVDGRDWEILSADPVRGLGGSILYYEANL